MGKLRRRTAGFAPALNSSAYDHLPHATFRLPALAQPSISEVVAERLLPPLVASVLRQLRQPRHLVASARRPLRQAARSVHLQLPLQGASVLLRPQLPVDLAASVLQLHLPLLPADLARQLLLRLEPLRLRLHRPRLEVRSCWGASPLAAAATSVGAAARSHALPSPPPPAPPAHFGCQRVYHAASSV